MKKLITSLSILTIFILSIISFNAQAQNSNFSMELQNSSVHNAVIYPNPVIDYKFNIQSNQIISEIEVLNVIGKTIVTQVNENFSTDDLTVNLPQCEKGMYIVKIIFNDETHIIKKLLVN